MSQYKKLVAFCASLALHRSTTASLEYNWLTAIAYSSHVVYYLESSLFRIYNISTKLFFFLLSKTFIMQKFCRDTYSGHAEVNRRQGPTWRRKLLFAKLLPGSLKADCLDWFALPTFCTVLHPKIDLTKL